MAIPLSPAARASASAGAGGGAAPWTPAAPSGLITWFDATKLTGLTDRAFISVWPDGSPRGHDASAIDIGPQYIVNAYNGLPAVRFVQGGGAFITRAVMQVAGLGTEMAGRSSYTVLLVLAVFDVSNGPVVLASAEDTAQWFLRYSSTAAAVVWANATTSSPYVAAAVSIVPGALTQLTLTDAAGTTEYVAQDGAETSYSVAFPAVAATDPDGYIGGSSDEFVDIAADIAELLIYDHALTATDRATVQGYLHGKWMTSGPAPLLTTPTILAPVARTQAQATLTVGTARPVPTGPPPPQWPGFMRATAVGTNLALVKSPPYVFAAGTQLYAYMLLRTTVPGLSLIINGVTTATRYANVFLTTTPGGWVLARVTATIGATAEAVTLTAQTRSVASAGDTLDMTGVTLCAGVDPGGPFSGDLDDEFNYAYRWASSSGRNASPSHRHTTQYDLLAVAEGEAGIDIGAQGLSIVQRQKYLAQRFQARYQPSLGDSAHDTSGAVVPTWLTGFKAQIGDVIRADGTSYDDNRTTVFVNAAARSFTVQIAYSASGPLIDRIIRLIMDIKPAHLGFDPASGLTAGAFLADVGQTDTTPL